ncbi:hypothetical protein ABH989_002191 [Bradyrhizobium ottawaense]
MQAWSLNARVSTENRTRPDAEAGSQSQTPPAGRGLSVRGRVARAGPGRGQADEAAQSALLRARPRPRPAEAAAGHGGARRQCVDPGDGLGGRRPGTCDHWRGSRFRGASGRTCRCTGTSGQARQRHGTAETCAATGRGIRGQRSRPVLQQRRRSRRRCKAGLAAQGAGEGREPASASGSPRSRPSGSNTRSGWRYATTS